MIPTVILAGGKAKPELQALIGQTNRALAVVNGKTLLRHVIDAISSAGPDGGPLGPMTVIGDLPDDPDYQRLPDSGDLTQNIFSGLNVYADAPRVLICTSDLPFLSGDAVSQFVAQASKLAEQSGAGLVWPIVPVAACYERYPGIRRTALRLREGLYTGGNLALVRPAFLLTQRERIAAAYEARKSPLRLALMLGPTTIARLIGSRLLSPRLLSVARLEAAVSRLLGGTARALPCNLPAIATDLDRPSDFEALAAMSKGEGENEPRD